MTFQIQIEDGIEIPTRELAGRPRETQYPLAQMKEGQSFALLIEGVDGAVKNKKDGTTETLTAAQDAERKARQKQSYFSALGKRLGLTVVTRWFPENGVLRVWHGGAAPEPAAGTAEPEAAQEDGALDLDV